VPQLTAITMLAKGGLVMIPLLVCPVLSLSVVIERRGFWWRRRDAAAAERALQLAVHGKLDEATEIAGASLAPSARVIAAGLSHRDNGAGQAMERDAQEELALARRHLPLLDTVITFLGTVTSASRRRSPPRPASPCSCWSSRGW